MTGQDIQDRLDAIVSDLQTTQKGNGTSVTFRNNQNIVRIFQLTADEIGVVNAAQLSAIQTYVDILKQFAVEYKTAALPVQTALAAFKAAQAPHKPLIDAARAARVALHSALDNDANYQAAKNALDTARADPTYSAGVDN